MTALRFQAPGLHGDRERGFTLLELIVAMSVFGLIGLGIFGVLVLGARSAASGERISEQARRYRVANEILVRQVAGAEPLQLPQQGDEGLGDDEEAQTAEPFFHGFADTLEFVTTAPQRPDASGMAIVSYWLEDGTLKMSERPVFTAYGSKKKLDRDTRENSLVTVLLYDVESVTFAYQRESDSDEWLDKWDATDEEKLPACVRIDVAPSAAGGPDFYHEMPVMVGVFNQIADTDGDFHSRRVRGNGAGGGGGGGGGKGSSGGVDENTDSPSATVDPDNED